MGVPLKSHDLSRMLWELLQQESPEPARTSIKGRNARAAVTQQLHGTHRVTTRTAGTQTHALNKLMDTLEVFHGHLTGALHRPRELYLLYQRIARGMMDHEGVLVSVGPEYEANGVERGAQNELGLSRWFG